MEERAPHSSDEVRILAPESPKPDNDESNYTTRPSATYVVQVPKDTIYRVPPPENAAIAERRRNEPANKQAGAAAAKSRSGSGAAWCCCSVLILAVLLLFFALSAGLLTTALRPKLPVFVIERLAAVDDEMYQVLVRSDNPNSRLDISYEARRRGGGSGEVGLWLGKNQIAAGKFPAYFHAHGSSTEVEILLQRRNSSSKTTTLSSKGKAKVSLKMSDLEARTEVWTWNTGNLEFDVACEVAVDSLIPRNTTTSHVLTQTCRTTKRD